MTKLSIAFAIIALSVGCGSKKDPEKKLETSTKPTEQPNPDDKSQPDRAADKATPTAGGSLPSDCGEYRALIDKLSSCGEKIPAATRDQLKKHFDTEWAAWEKTPAEGKAQLASVCKTAADNVKIAASAPCGW